jgi:hypothetical protein
MRGLHCLQIIQWQKGGGRSMLVVPAVQPAPFSASMAQQNTGCGCGTLIGLAAVGFVLAYWQAFLVAALLILAIAAVVYAVLLQNQQQLLALVQAADRRVRHDPCRVRDCFGVIQSLTLAGDFQTPRIDVRCQTIQSGGGSLGSGEVCLSLSPPAERLQLHSSAGVTHWLRSGGVSKLDDLSVEAKAVKAAMECLRERDWTHQALDKLHELRSSVIDTLAKAKGNELLEAAIPQLQQALAAFNDERDKLQEANRNAAEMLRKLHDFLSVPDGMRPILTFDFDQLFDPQRFSALEQSFADVVLLNDAFRELSKDKLA